MHTPEQKIKEIEKQEYEDRLTSQTQTESA